MRVDSIRERIVLSGVIGADTAAAVHHAVDYQPSEVRAKRSHGGNVPWRHQTGDDSASYREKSIVDSADSLRLNMSHWFGA